ncbi:MAG: energy-coupled thiamine transporter ThiT [bacterium]
MKMTRDISISGLAIALAFVLSAFKIFRMPQGGEISLEMLPILLVGLWRGTRTGIATGVLFGLLHALQGATIYHPLQFLLDYPLAFGVLGLSGLMGKRRLSLAGSLVGIFVAVGARFFCHFLSGFLFIQYFAPAALPRAAVYSLIYNASYLLPELAVSLFILPPMAARLARAGVAPA